MGYGGGFGGEADTGGVAGGSSSNSNSNSGGHDGGAPGPGRGGNAVSGPSSSRGGLGMDGGAGGRPGGGISSAAIGAANAVANGTQGNTNGGNAGGRGGGGGGGNSNYSGTLGESLDARSATPDSRTGASMTGSNAMVSMDVAAEDAKRSFGGWASQLDTQGPNTTNYGALSNDAYGRATAPSISPEARTSALQVAGLPEQIARDARPSMVNRGLTLAASLANPALGLAASAYGVHNAAQNAQQSISDINNAFGTNMDDSYATALGQQTIGSVSGLLGGKVGGKVGADIGMTVAGVPGAIAAGLLGSVLGSNTTRSVAMSPNTTTEGPQGPIAGGETQPASVSSAPATAVAASTRPQSGYVSIDDYAMDSTRNPFDRYSNYAAQFFGA